MQAGGGVYVGDRLTCTNSVYAGRFRVLTRPLFHVRKGTMVDEICTIDGCEKLVNAKGLCAMHYARQRRKKIPTVSTAKTRLQEVDAMRRVLAAKIDDESTPARDLSPLVRRLEELSELSESLRAREAEASDDAKVRSSDDTPWELMDI